MSSLYDELMEMVIDNSLTEQKIERKGYFTNGNYYGWTGKEYQKFANEGEYDEWYEENCEDELDESVLLADIDELINEAVYDYSYDLLTEAEAVNFVDRTLNKINGLAKLNLTKKDLVNPSKIDAALKSMPEFSEQQKKKKTKAIVNLIICLLNFIATMIFDVKYSVAATDDAINSIRNVGIDAANKVSALFGGDQAKYLDTNTRAKYFKGLMACLIVSISSLVFTSFGLNDDYQRLIIAFDKAIRKIDKQIAKAKKKDDPASKEYIASLKSAKADLVANKAKVTAKYKEETKKYNAELRQKQKEKEAAKKNKNK